MWFLKSLMLLNMEKSIFVMSVFVSLQQTEINMEDDVFYCCMCPHYSAVIHHHYSCFDHYIDCFLCELLTAILICEQAVCHFCENGIVRLKLLHIFFENKFPLQIRALVAQSPFMWNIRHKMPQKKKPLIHWISDHIKTDGDCLKTKHTGQEVKIKRIILQDFYKLCKWENNLSLLEYSRTPNIFQPAAKYF